MMFNPCRDHCYLRYGKEYTPECDSTCDFAKVVKENEALRSKVEKLSEGIFQYQDAYNDVVKYLEEEISDETYTEHGTTRCEVLSNKEKIERIVSEHYKCVTQFGVDRKWSCIDACEAAPGFHT